MSKENQVLNSSPETNEFAVKKITPLFWKYSIFGLAGLSFQAISVIADGIFVGTTQGTMGLATIGIVASLWTVTLSLTALLGIGGSTLIAARLGEGDREGARQAYAASTIFTFSFSLVLTILSYLYMEPILMFLGATENILPHAVAYATPYILATPFCITGGALYYYCRAMGKPFASALSYILPAIIATIAEYIALFVLGLGMEGSAISWIICVGLAFPLVFYLQFSKNGYKIKFSDFKLNFMDIWTAMKIGFAPFISQLSVILTTVVINRQIIAYSGGELGIACYATINAYIIYIVMLLCNSLISGLLPIASFNFGLERYDRVHELLKKASIQSTLGLTVLLALIFLFAKPIVAFFVGADVDLIEPTITMMQHCLPLYTFGLLSLIISGYFQAVERNGIAIFTGLSKVIISTPLLFLFPLFLDYNGIWYAQPVADGAIFVLSVILIIRELKRLKKMEKESPHLPVKEVLNKDIGNSVIQ